MCNNQYIGAYYVNGIFQLIGIPVTECWRKNRGQQDFACVISQRLNINLQNPIYQATDMLSISREIWWKARSRVNATARVTFCYWFFYYTVHHSECLSNNQVQPTFFQQCKYHKHKRKNRTLGNHFISTLEIPKSECNKEKYNLSRLFINSNSRGRVCIGVLFT